MSRALASVTIMTTAAALAIGTLPSAASASSAASRTAHSAHPARSAPSVRTALAGAAARAAASQQPGSPAVGSSPLAGAITGTVRGLGVAPLTGACVTATGSGKSVTSRARTDGRFAITGLTPGAYTVSYRDCAQPAKYFEQQYGAAAPGAGATPVTVSTGQPAQLAPVTLRATDPAAEVAAMRHAVRARLGQMSPATSGGVISGTVKNRAGKVIPHMCVQAYTSTSWWITRTGKRGGYRLPVGTSGKWKLEFSGGCGSTGNYAPQWWRRAATGPRATRLTERPGRSFHGIDGVLRRGASISGKVTSATTGAGLRHVCVDAQGLHGMRDVEMEALTRADGSYTIKNLGTGRYTISFEAECGTADYLDASRKGAVSVTDGKTTSGIDAALRPGAEIHGVVTSAATGTPVPDVCVDVQNGDAEDVTSATGSYALTGLRPGSYTLSFTPGCGFDDTSYSYAPQYYDNVTNAVDATPVNLSEGQAQTGINAALQPGGTVTGQVTSKSGAPLAGVCIVLTSRNEAGGLGTNVYLRELSSFFEEDGTGFTGPKGHFTVRNLSPGQYEVTFLGGCGHGSAKYAPQVFEPQGGGQWISVGTGAATAGVSGVLQVGGIISGTVTRSGGKGLRNICVTAVRKGGAAATQFSFALPITHRDGSYQLGGLATGRYAVQFSPCFGQPYAPQWYKGKSRQAAATLVAVQAGHATRGVSVTMVSGGTLTGHVRSGVTGGPVRNVCVFVTDASGNVVTAGLTNSLGLYRIRHVPAGQWTLQPALCIAANPALAAIVRGDYRVRNNATTRVSLTLPRGGAISGTVQGGSPAAADSGICVEVSPVTGHGQPELGLTGPDGNYTVSGLASGKYRVLFTPLCLFGTAAVTPQWYNDAASGSAATPVSVTAGQTTTGIGGTLADDGAISGTVTVSGTATAGVCVGAYAGSAAKPAAIAITGKDGSYQISGLAAGSYSVEFTQGCGAASYTAQWYGGTTRAAATPVTVTAGSTATGIDAS